MLLSLMVMAIFILIAFGSDIGTIWAGIAPDETVDEDGNWESVHQYSRSYEVTTGKRDDKKRWHGPVVIDWKSRSGDLRSKEEVEMVHGVRHGWSTKTIGSFENPSVTKTYYVMGVEFEKKNSKKKALAEVSPHEIIYNKYSWFKYSLLSNEFDSLYVNEFLDTVMIMLNSYEPSVPDFDDYYGDITEELEETPWDSILSYNYITSLHRGFEQIKNNEYRMAAIDRARSGAESTYAVVQEHYPNYLLALEQSEVTAMDFEILSLKVDSIMATYSPLDSEDPFFTDSVDMRLFRALNIVYESGEADEKAAHAVSELNSFNSTYDLIGGLDLLSPRHTGNSLLMDPPDVAMVVIVTFLMDIEYANVIKYAVKEAYMKNMEVAYLPLLTTEYLGGTDATSMGIRGYVVEDGGAAVSSRGIAWASHYNPSIDDNVEASGSGRGEFTVSLDGLIEGDRYFARTYATNSVGTAYGSNVEFLAQSTVGILPHEDLNEGMKIYPNPANSLAMIDLNLDSPLEVSVLIYDLKGSLVFSTLYGLLPAGPTTIELDVSALMAGMYQCQVMLGTSGKLSASLMITD